jgi:RNA polymerase sigma factor (sigma-70 family)
MNIAAVSKLKHGRMWKAMQDLGWSQSDLARESGLSPTAIGRYANLQERPSEANAQKIQNAFGRRGVFFDVVEAWPEGFQGVKHSVTITRYADVPVDRFLYAQNMQEKLEYRERRLLMDGPLNKVLEDLNEQESEVIQQRFFSNASLGETGRVLGVGRERIRQIEAKALRKLRYPTRLRQLEHLIQFRD